MKKSIFVILFLIFTLSLTAQNADYSVGRLNTTFQVGSFGDAEFFIPIELPEKSGALSQISLNYSSLNGYGYLGFGFEIGGLSVIERTNKNLFFDGVSSVIDFAKGSDYLLDGKRFIRISVMMKATRTVFRGSIRLRAITAATFHIPGSSTTIICFLPSTPTNIQPITARPKMNILPTV